MSVVPAWIPSVGGASQDRNGPLLMRFFSSQDGASTQEPLLFDFQLKTVGLPSLILASNLGLTYLFGPTLHQFTKLYSRVLDYTGVVL